MSNLSGRDIIAMGSLSLEEIQLVLDAARGFEERGATGRLLSGRILATLFYEPSTRTRLSFESAMHRLGGSVISVAQAKTASSAAKGESLADAARVISSYADVIVLRHPLVGAAERAAEAATVPIINAGDGPGEHPTQALLDLYTIRKEKGRINGARIALIGDLKFGRTVHSLVQAFSHFEVELSLVSPPQLRLPAEFTEHLRRQGVPFEETDSLRAAVEWSDVLYVTRIQRERFSDPAEYERLKGSYVIDMDLLGRAKEDVIVMHPLPRVDEIPPQVDAHPGAAYFRQAANGIFVRMALLALVLGAPL